MNLKCNFLLITIACMGFATSDLEISDVVYYLSSEQIIEFPPYSRELIDTRFYLLSTVDPSKEYRLKNNDSLSFENTTFDAQKPTKFVVHGFIDSSDSDWISTMSETLNIYGDYNVIKVDWRRGARTLYGQAVANTRVVALEISLFMEELEDEFGLKPQNFHCIGHSLGAHICGFVGYLTNDLGRITGLDPAGPYFTNATEEDRLSSPDAIFVEAIHTNSELLGTPTPVGTIDIYVNSGKSQPQCEESRFVDITNEDYIPRLISCDHLSSIDYFTESLLNSSCQFVAYECSSYEDFIMGKCNTCGDDSSKCAFMGIRGDEYVDYSTKERKFYIQTSKEQPYCTHHYAVNISSPGPEIESRPKGNLILHIYGTNGNFTSKIGINKTYDNEPFITKLLTSHTDVGEIESVSITWTVDIGLQDLIYDEPSFYTKGIKVSPLTHYPEEERREFEAVLCNSDGSRVEIKSDETVSFSVQDSCPDF